MIFLYTGLNGSGKTFLMIWHVFQEWVRGRDVYSNTHLFFRLDDCGWLMSWYRKARRWVGTGEIHYFHEIYEIQHVRDACIIFDEGQTLFYARYFDQLPAEFVYKITQQRKHGLDLYCTTPDAMMIDVQYFRLIHEWYYFETRFAFPRSGPKLLQLSNVYIKDTTKAIRGKEQALVPNLGVFRLWIGKMTGKPRLYNTNFDVGFQRFKTIYTQEICDNQKTQKLKSLQKAWILPKEMSISEVLKSTRSYGFTSSQTKSARFQKN